MAANATSKIRPSGGKTDLKKIGKRIETIETVVIVYEILSARETENSRRATPWLESVGQR